LGEVTDILPAYAGVIPVDVGVLCWAWNSSRVCGGDPAAFNILSAFVAFFPRMRG